MAYLALYRAWRPRRFAEVVGQEKTVMALRNAVREGKVSHAYLFSGPRGTGKTSIAKIIAKAVNCENLAEGEPCNSCSSCQDINNGNFMDVIEIDAASNRGIDEIRDLREKVRVLPAQGKNKVYIIDEVHMLTTEAFNALLKTIEEPPDAVVFILATTEPHKIPATIRSRCQVFNFRRLTTDEILERLTDVAANDEIILEPEALLLLARRANGGMRDALSMLDQIYSYKGNNISKQDVLEVMGLVDDLFMTQLFAAVFSQNTPAIIEILGTAFSEGKEAQHLAREAAMFLRDFLLYLALGKEADLTVAGEESQAFFEQQKGKISNQGVLGALRIMMDTADKLRFSEGQKYLLEIAFLEMATLFREETTAAPPPLEEKKPKKESSARAKPPQNEAQDLLWSKILAGVKGKKIPTHALLVQGKLLGIKDDTIYIAYKKGYKFHKERMEERGNSEILAAVLKETLGRDMESQFIFLDDDQYNDIIVKKAVEFFGEELVEIKD
ncbi:MAG: DNA polymerase III subunit gamma/tau [Syntrophomonas sp.]|uniref:DNA polymerase III subunit gamma/tau n=1 Tax=Syntrophomonas sp. TaxID=2053627 RepID=UPI002637DC74|nr:DNA polymerase III subunit gamma/tau [Syntrophomonas sp.]MDD2511203.1 DNA polymerase III subunit gamma/tau [Syntrophomonas sp.]MDD4627145.1 DNA polymerase III subunit gamma/tau [Syntrophomonas sp.]